MLAYKLEVIIYPNGGYEWYSEGTSDPTWLNIETAIRRLDRCEYPFLHIYVSPGAEASAIASLDVIGGKGEHGMSANDRQWRERFRFRDLSRPNGPKLIDIWITDQGASFEETYLCNDLTVVLAVCKYFVETGHLDPSVNWEKRRNEHLLS